MREARGEKMREVMCESIGNAMRESIRQAMRESIGGTPCTAQSALQREAPRKTLRDAERETQPARWPRVQRLMTCVEPH
jgi:hypothetical protein